MTTLAQTAIRALSRLSPAQQDAIAIALIIEVARAEQEDRPCQRRAA